MRSCQAPPLFENLVASSTPLPSRKEGCTPWLCNPFNTNAPFLYPLKKIQGIKEYWYETVIVSLLLIWTSIFQFLWISCRLFKFQLLLVVIIYTLAFQIQSICSQCTLYLPPENIRKPYVLLFPGGRERVNWEQMC